MGGACYSRDDAQPDTRADSAAKTEGANSVGGASGSTYGVNSRSGWYTDDGSGTWAWQPVLKVPEGLVNRRGQEGERDGGEDTYAGFDVDGWLEMAESGELDIYSCLGCSDASVLNDDTRALIMKIIGVLVLQCMVPGVMLYLQLTTGFSFRPHVPDIGFRIIGFILYLYSLYWMYNNALDECRYRLLKFALDNRVTAGYWGPLVLGEFANTIVSLVLVFTLFFIYTNSRGAMDLVLNAVAVNFLGSVDAEMVSPENMKDCIENFKELMSKFRTVSAAKDDNMAGKITDVVLTFMLFSIVFSGMVLALLFLLLESPSPQEA